MSKLSRTLEQLETLIVSGSVSEVRNMIIELSSIRRMPREARLKLAHYARRAHMPGKAISLLHRTVRPANGARDGGTTEERAEYAAALTALGATHEARSILDALDAKQYPLAWYFRAVAALSQWDWDASIAPFEHFIHSPNPPGDFPEWARIFLANSLSRGPGDFDRAEALAEEVLKATGPQNNRMAYKNALLSLLMTATLRHSWASANQVYERIQREDLDDSDPLFILAVEQWKAVIDIMTASKAQRAHPADRLRRIINAYTVDRRWENVRGAELNLGIALEDHEKLYYLGFGTPYPAFRKRAFEEARKAGGAAEPPRFYDRVLAEGPRRANAFIDSADGRTALNPKAYLKPGFLMQRLLAGLASDFYKPQQITELHEALYPGEKLLPTATPDRIHQLILRLRLWFEEHRLPLEIEEHFGAYSLVSRQPFQIRVWAEEEARRAEELSLSPDEEADLQKLRSRFASGQFTASDAARALAMPLRSTIRRLNESVTAGALTRTGKARATRYQLTER